MKNSNQRTLLENWPVIQEDFKKFMSDRPGWLIDALENARNKKGNRGWQDVEKIINILQYLRDAEVEY